VAETDYRRKRRVAIDGADRRRLYLFRHGAVDYIDESGDWVADPDLVDLNPRGRAQAAGMARLFAGVHVDKALCTGLPRTRQTGETILGDRDIELEVCKELEEIRPLKGETAGGYDIYSDIAFSLADQSWHNLAVFAHGGTNAAVLGWATGVGLDAFGLLDQSMCCLNIIDFDIDDSGRLVRKTVRGMNITADDPVMRDRYASDMELLARRILKWQT
jgi:probable phosphoglycerate mutase